MLFQPARKIKSLIYKFLTLRHYTYSPLLSKAASLLKVIFLGLQLKRYGGGKERGFFCGRNLLHFESITLKKGHTASVSPPHLLFHSSTNYSYHLILREQTTNVRKQKTFMCIQYIILCLIVSELHFSSW